MSLNFEMADDDQGHDEAKLAVELRQSLHCLLNERDCKRLYKENIESKLMDYVTDLPKDMARQQLEDEYIELGEYIKKRRGAC